MFVGYRCPASYVAKRFVLKTFLCLVAMLSEATVIPCKSQALTDSLVGDFNSAVVKNFSRYRTVNLYWEMNGNYNYTFAKGGKEMEKSRKEDLHTIRFSTMIPVVKVNYLSLYANLQYSNYNFRLSENDLSNVFSENDYSYYKGGVSASYFVNLFNRPLLLSGVQNFQIGGPQQSKVGNLDMPIGSENWKNMLRWTLDECERLGLTFGTHNCPGWTSSAYTEVEPKYSMLKLVYSEVVVPKGESYIELPRPQVDSVWNYYEDVVVLAMPNDSVVDKRNIVDITSCFDFVTGRLCLPDSVKAGMTVLRIGQTTNGKTNEAQAPESGRGLECDKMSREAVLRFWNTYPQMVLDVAGHHAGKTFVNFEIDSYEAGGQTWSSVLSGEFKRRRGYDMTVFMPLIIGRCMLIGSKEETRRFHKDWQNTVQELFAENYYG